MMRAGGMSEGRDIGVVFNMPRKVRRLRAAGVRRRRRAIHAGGRMGAGAALSRARSSASKQCAQQHCRRARRRSVDGHQWILGGAQYRDHRATAASVLHRGQWLRNFGAVAAANSGRQHRRQSGRAFAGCGCSMAMASDPLSGRGADRRRRGRRAVRRGTGADPAGGAAPLRSLGPGHADLQERRGNRRRKSARSLARLRAQLVPHMLSAADWESEDLARRATLVAETLARGRAARGTRPDAHSALSCFPKLAPTGRIDLQQQGGMRCDGRRACARAPSGPSRRVRASIWSPRCAARSSTSLRSIRAC